ncbi:MAG: hypothetical protein N2589_01855, partial [bacterium]|nr:hypothetical protein [bacterium]
MRKEEKVNLKFLLFFLILFIILFIIFKNSFCGPTYVYIKNLNTSPLRPFENTPFDIIVSGEYSSSSQEIFYQSYTVSENSITIIFKNKIPDGPS